MVDPSMTRDPNDMGEDERIAEMGKPKLGDIDKLRVTIKESTEFKASYFLCQISFPIVDLPNETCFLIYQ